MRRCRLLTLLVLMLPAALRSAPDQVAVAIIVNPKNMMPDPSLAQLRSILSLDQQFWPDGSRVMLVLPPSSSIERRTLLASIYALTDEQLRQRWVGRLFAGEIPAIPSVAPNAARAAALVGQAPGAIAAVRADEVTAAVRVLLLDGKRIGDTGYPLVGTEAP